MVSIGTVIGKALGYGVQMIAYHQLFETVGPRSAILVPKTVKCTARVIQYTSMGP